MLYDITICASENCTLEKYCFRKTTPANPYRQSYSDFSNTCHAFKYDEKAKSVPLTWDTSYPLVLRVTFTYTDGLSVGFLKDFSSVAKELIKVKAFTEDTVINYFVLGVFNLQHRLETDYPKFIWDMIYDNPMLDSLNLTKIDKSKTIDTVYIERIFR